MPIKASEVIEIRPIQIKKATIHQEIFEAITVVKQKSVSCGNN